MLTTTFLLQVQVQLDDSIEAFGKVVKVLRLMSSAAMQLLTVLVGAYCLVEIPSCNDYP